MRTVIAQIYDYSLDGITPEEGTSFFDFCRELPDDPDDVDRTRDFYENADVLILGRNHYQGAAQYFPGAVGHPYAAVINAARKVVFSHTLRATDWANTSARRPGPHRRIPRASRPLPGRQRHAALQRPGAAGQARARLGHPRRQRNH
jgi:hypothetical protein